VNHLMLMAWVTGERAALELMLSAACARLMRSEAIYNASIVSTTHDTPIHAPTPPVPSSRVGARH
jgi:hypothetical protein